MLYNGGDYSRGAVVGKVPDNPVGHPLLLEYSLPGLQNIPGDNLDPGVSAGPLTVPRSSILRTKSLPQIVHETPVYFEEDESASVLRQMGRHRSDTRADLPYGFSARQLKQPDDLLPYPLGYEKILPKPAVRGHSIGLQKPGNLSGRIVVRD